MIGHTATEYVWACSRVWHIVRCTPACSSIASTCKRCMKPRVHIFVVSGFLDRQGWREGFRVTGTCHGCSGLSSPQIALYLSLGTVMPGSATLNYAAARAMCGDPCSLAQLMQRRANIVMMRYDYGCILRLGPPLHCRTAYLAGPIC
jgi:hypothetical protein